MNQTRNEHRMRESLYSEIKRDAEKIVTCLKRANCSLRVSTCLVLSDTFRAINDAAIN